MNERYQDIIIGSGAGGSAAAYALARGGRRVLLLEKGRELPRDGSTLDVDKVIRQGIFKSKEHWLDKNGRTFEPEEYFNLGGKTKWYGAALVRFEPRRVRSRIGVSMSVLADRLPGSGALLRASGSIAGRPPASNRNRICGPSSAADPQRRRLERRTAAAGLGPEHRRASRGSGPFRRLSLRSRT